MPLYEVLLQYPDRAELRLTDRPSEVGDTLVAAGKLWYVVGLERETKHVRATARFVCKLAGDQRQRPRRMQTAIEMKQRIANQPRGRAAG